jgi:hypothetical protein
MSIRPVGSTFNLPTDQVGFSSKSAQEEVDFSDPSTSLEKQPQAESPPVWYFSGCYPCGSSMDIPIELAVKYNRKLYDFRKGVVGLILPYPHGFDSEPWTGVARLGLSFLHLFNLGKSKVIISGTVDGVKFENIEIPVGKRMTLELSTQRNS